MGLGKTLQILTLVHTPQKKPSLIVCPASVVPVWQGEAKRWYPQLPTQVLGSKISSSLAQKRRCHALDRQLLQLRRHKQLLETIEFGYAVLDEAQQIKNPEAKVTQACCSIQAECQSL